MCTTFLHHRVKLLQANLTSFCYLCTLDYHLEDEFCQEGESVLQGDGEILYDQP